MADIVSILAEQISRVLLDQQFNPNSSVPNSDIAPTSSGKSKQINLEASGRIVAEDLIREALASGLQLSVLKFKDRSLTGGNTAEFVGEITLSVPFVLKVDSNTKKLSEEAKVIRTIKNNLDLPVQYRQSWPEIYAIRYEAPYAYLMEYFHPSDGWVSMENLMYDKKFGKTGDVIFIRKCVERFLSISFIGARSSINNRLIPNINQDYISRIKERLTMASNKDNRFRSVRLIINNVEYNPWRYYLDLIESSQTKLQLIHPPFSTIVHGDPNPGNILLNLNSSDLDLKMIDPKDWLTGDYLFDLCKLTHFISVTGPVEHPINDTPKVLISDIEGGYSFDYKTDYQHWTNEIVSVCLGEAEKFANQNGDENWEIRYQLGMASNLLGLPIGRLQKINRLESAAICYAEGIIWLDRFCKSLQELKNEN
ncbi:phosphotransferase [Pedobacter alluvionis]|uniref:Phosphotransferase family enzyme n=1 Tax=Pedobacter alluvionis TaxID=475253 RepID=A0A497Y9F6_9SPHI|nr:phosphotransferase [Pedobacter alluvionis]RLJ80192.1 phosphotransferase family enzyme [Pedobacter alluvionis]TFB31477.1 hypothetical protein E3V97_12845 [Pedobacter alluvionis]